MSRAAPVLVAMLLGSAAAQDLPPDGRRDWSERDLEGKWVAWQSDIRAVLGHRKAWIAWLARNCEFELLEWIAIADDWRDATNALTDAGAPQWVRVLAWGYRNSSDSHRSENAETVLRVKSPETVKAWLLLHRNRLSPEGRLLLESAAISQARPGSAEGLLPPLDSAEVFAALDPPLEVDIFGDLREALPGRVYVHQVERALRALTSLTGRPKPGLDRAVALFRHPHPAVRRSALLEATRLGADFPAHAQVLALADHAGEDADVREAAVLALSCSAHPAAWLALHRIAQDPGHPGWKAAVSRLSDFADPFTARRLEETVFRRSEVPGHEWMPPTRARARDIAAAYFEPLTEAKVVSVLDRAAWASLVRDPLAAALESWVLDALRPHTEYRTPREVIEKVRDDYQPRHPGSHATAEGYLQDRVRALAGAVLKR